MTSVSRMLAFMVLLGFISAASAAGDAKAGKQKSATCSACHGADGNGGADPSWPKLAGQHASYLAKQLSNYKNGARVNAQMAPMAAPLSEQDIDDLAAFYAQQKARYAGADASEEIVEQGRLLYLGGNAETGVSACSGCHGPTGAGNQAAKFPALAGQHAKYTALQLQAFHSGERDNDPAGMMGATAGAMSAAEIEAVSAYIQGLRPATKR